MKRLKVKFIILVMASMSGLSMSAQAALLAYEGFDAVGNIRVRDMVPGYGFTNNADLTNYRYRTYDSAGLSYTDGNGNSLEVEGQYGGMDLQVSGTKNMQLELTGGAISTGTVYMSYLLDVDNGTSGFTAGLLSGAVGASSSMGSVMQAMVRTTSTGWGNFGVPSGIDDVGGPTTAGLHFVVVALDLDAGTMTTYFDPGDLSDVPGSATHTIASTGTFSPITHFGLTLGSNFGYVDEIRIGTTMADAVPFTAPPTPTLYAYEGFDAVGNIRVRAMPGGMGFTNNLDLTNYRMRTYDSAGLSYTDGNGNSLEVEGQFGGMDVLIFGTKNLQLELTDGAISSGTVYMSYLFDADNATNGFTAGLLSGAVGASSSMGSVMQAMVRATSTGWGNFGVPSGIDDVGGPTNAGLHFVVAEVNLDAGTMTTYFDPTNLTDVVGSASHTVVSAGATFSPITHFGFSLGANIGYVDEVRIGNTIEVVTPYSVTPVFYDAWALDKGLTSGVNDALTDDPDVDGNDNLMEYSVNGDPLVADSATESFAGLDGETNWFYHVHNQRTDDGSLTYTLELGVDLVDESGWGTTGVEFVGESASVDNYKSMTNRTDVSNKEFIKLTVEKN
ncbi:hypothetical protein [Pontiella sulfatireligans]|uniref:Uncharacterized protein n=1 Tax=Pontiella sulfatireligans TaxID=2750658 RepID=A0A6C2UG16_9BACT|nr:hypothetical protein [Pontiella sulfatireligans]VGO19105.1 hypothetical protein SCARR_01161 [Pontiella sulfatireligans]